MSIVSSTYETSGPADGTRHVVEQHTDHLGNVYMQSFFAPAGFDIAAKVAAHATQLADQLAQGEIAGELDG
jgi:hypothetical protein